MDLALAYRLKMKLAQDGKELQPWQVQAMTHACRDAKEALLNDAELQAVPIVVPSRGSKLLGATLKTELTQQEVQQTLVDGFFPQVGVQEHPVQRARGALTQMGLPYAQDAAITRHIAAFLSRQSNATENAFAGIPGMEAAPEFVKPTALLFNGGVLKSKLLSDRLFNTINSWLESANAEKAKMLSGLDLDLAVASGAATTAAFVAVKAFAFAVVLRLATISVSRALCPLFQVWLLQWKHYAWLLLVWKKAAVCRYRAKNLVWSSVNLFTSNSLVRQLAAKTKQVST